MNLSRFALEGYIGLLVVALFALFMAVFSGALWFLTKLPLTALASEAFAVMAFVVVIAAFLWMAARLLWEVLPEDPPNDPPPVLA